MANRIAVEFVRDILSQNPGANNFGDIYDAMTRAACTRSFRNLGHAELSMAGISFSLLSFSHLEHLIAEVQRTMLSEGTDLETPIQ
jgi:hypothetical protein